MNYDAAGNLTRDIYTGYGNATFDANNRITAIQDITGSSSNYVYNAEGQRRRRISNNQETWQIYGFAGELLAEYPANGPVLTPTREYGYRNGQLLVVAAGTSGWGPAPTLTDNPLQVGATTIQALHITELRTAINALRSNLSMPAYSWTTSATTSDWINPAPILEMRTALDQALGAPANGYAAGLAQNQLVLAVHIQELRDRVLAAWQTGSGFQHCLRVVDSATHVVSELARNSKTIRRIPAADERGLTLIRVHLRKSAAKINHHPQPHRIDRTIG